MFLLEIAKNIYRNANFKQWFSNSIVRDASGKPLIVHHGTKARFNTFRKTDGLGFHFGTYNSALERVATKYGSVPSVKSFGRFPAKTLNSPEKIDRYCDIRGHDLPDNVVEPLLKAQEVMYLYPNKEYQKNIIDFWKGFFEENHPIFLYRFFKMKLEDSKDIFGFYLRITNPITLDDWEDWIPCVMLYVLHKKPPFNQFEYNKEFTYVYEGHMMTPTTLKWIKSQLIKAGYDGIVYENHFEDEGSTSYVAFKPNQIKSINNDGTFDVSDPNFMS